MLKARCINIQHNLVVGVPESIVAGDRGMIVQRMIDLRRTCAGMLMGATMNHGCRSDSLRGNREYQQPN